MWIDTHAHLYAKAFNSDREAMLANAIHKGVGRFLLPNVDSESIPGMLALEAAHPGRCFAMMGLHPCSVKEDFEAELAIVKEWLDKRDFLAIGEIGIDLYWDKTFFEQQKVAFSQQVDWALALDKPIVVHARESLDVLIDLLEERDDKRLRGVFHCFTGTAAQANAIMELGLYIGVGGVVTYKNGQVDQTLKEISLERVILETDAPYLAPIPHRGKRNESGYIPFIGAKVADIKGLRIEEVATITTQNAVDLFRLPAMKTVDNPDFV